MPKPNDYMIELGPSGQSIFRSLCLFTSVEITLLVNLLALERTFLSYLRTSLALSIISVTVAQLFRLQSPAEPRKRLGYYVLGKPISGGLMVVAILVCLLGVYRFWRQQNAMLRGKVYAGGWEVNTIGASIALGILIVFALLLAVNIA